MAKKIKVHNIEDAVSEPMTTPPVVITLPGEIAADAGLAAGYALTIVVGLENIKAFMEKGSNTEDADGHPAAYRGDTGAILITF